MINSNFYIAQTVSSSIILEIIIGMWGFVFNKNTGYFMHLKKSVAKDINDNNFKV